jgi:hypothetical protein
MSFFKKIFENEKGMVLKSSLIGFSMASILVFSVIKFFGVPKQEELENYKQTILKNKEKKKMSNKQELNDNFNVKKPNE